MSFIIDHTSVTSHNTVCTKEEDIYDYGGSHTEEEHDYEDDRQDFYKFNKDSVHPDERYQLNEQEIRASRESQTSGGRTRGYHQGDRPPQWPRADRRHTSKTSGRKMCFFLARDLFHSIPATAKFNFSSATKI